VTANPAQPGRTQSSLANSNPGADGRGAMRIGIHDFSGHPFQVQLSRELASRGHEVVH